MIHNLIPGNYNSIIAMVGILFAFCATVLCTGKLSKYLPKDAGREFAHDGKLSAGKPRGAGIIFVLVFAVAAALFANVNAEIIIYLMLTIISMVTGYLDDASENPWSEYKKGFLDLCIAAMVALTFLQYNSNVIEIALLGIRFTIPRILFALLIVILVWVSVNVTNCSDGVDGLSGTLTIISIMTIYGIDVIRKTVGEFSFLILLFSVCILGYLWFNAAPSKLIMGDAGSRAMGLFISIAILKTGAPLLYIPVAFVILLDGGLGLVKVFLLRFFKIHIMKNIRTPLHDQVRKVWDWSNTQTVFRFGIIQIIISVALLYGLSIQMF
ncbi:phospho-N-acetylmuramoyl-pentapeptide-transferase [Lachnospiraceae bacterium OttesenSCG-928-D06]|nr:phospho-N-acetylmuramoyl-pentapeptide-transferase [Lachnospiraceae bacterium OttesenSCG-928-D06]